MVKTIAAAFAPTLMIPIRLVGPIYSYGDHLWKRNSSELHQSATTHLRLGVGGYAVLRASCRYVAIAGNEALGIDLMVAIPTVF